MKINEIFYSVQGEGPETGMVCWFIRTTGCNLTCSFCDTPYAFNEGTEMTFEQISEQINNDCKNIVITGGEPLLQKDLLDLIKYLGNYNFYIETNGTIFKQELLGYAKFIVSPKPQFMNKKYLETLKKWNYLSTFKFVVDNANDCNKALELCKQIGKENDIYFMPLGTDSKQIKKKIREIVKWCKINAPHVKVSSRLQIDLYGNKKGV